MTLEEKAISFECAGVWLHGIAHIPPTESSRGVIIVVGGPQYRVGSHRQFVLLARELAEAGIPVFRFDYRGMGDSEGETRDFEQVNDDLRAGIDAFCKAVPSLSEIVIWGLCDAASAAVFYARLDRRVKGLVLLNPWVRSTQGVARTYLKQYYLNRLLSKDFWRKLSSGRFQYAEATKSFLNHTTEALTPIDSDRENGEAVSAHSLPKRMYDGLSQFSGQVLIILSGNDLTAHEFRELMNSTWHWRRLVASKSIKHRILPNANHTFARREWRDQVTIWTREWLNSW